MFAQSDAVSSGPRGTNRYSCPFDWSRTVTLIRQAPCILTVCHGTLAVVSISSMKRPVTPPEAKRPERVLHLAPDDFVRR